MTSRPSPNKPAKPSGSLASILNGRPAADDAVLCLSELVTNACLHSNSRQPGGQFTVRIQRGGACSRVDVSDQGGPWITAASDDHAQNGRGLQIVGQLARIWGRTGDADTGWTTWFEIAGSPDLPASQPGTPDTGTSAGSPSSTDTNSGAYATNTA